MKKKLIVTALVVVATMCFSLMSGCFSGWVDSARIEFVEEPAKTYYKGANVNEVLDFVIRDMDKKVELRYSEHRGEIKVEGFDLSVAGTRNATVYYGDYSLTFTYTVAERDSLFAGGDGSAANPYLVSDAVEFQNMLNKGKNAAKNYFKLVSDINLLGVTIHSVSNWYEEDKNYFNGVIDGNGYRVLNVGNIEEGLGEAVKLNELFGLVGPDFTLKNIEINFAAEGALACTGLVTTMHPDFNKGSVVFDHVKVTGYIDLAERNNTSVGAFIAQADRASTTVGTLYSITNCTNELNIYNGSTTQFVSAYANTQAAAKFVFKNNTYKGVIEGGYHYTSVFVGYFSNNAKILSGASFANNTIDQANTTIVALNNTKYSGAYAISDITKEDNRAVIEAENEEVGELTCVKELATGTLKADGTIEGLTEEVVSVRVSYTTSYVPADKYAGAVMNSGVLIFVEEYEVPAEGALKILAPTNIFQTGSEGKDIVTAGMKVVVDENGVKTLYINRLDPAKGGELKALAVGYNAAGEIVWTSGNLTTVVANYNNGL